MHIHHETSTVYSPLSEFSATFYIKYVSKLFISRQQNFRYYTSLNRKLEHCYLWCFTVLRNPPVRECLCQKVFRLFNLHRHCSILPYKPLSILSLIPWSTIYCHSMSYLPLQNTCYYASMYTLPSNLFLSIHVPSRKFSKCHSKIFGHIIYHSQLCN